MGSRRRITTWAALLMAPLLANCDGQLVEATAAFDFVLDYEFDDPAGRVEKFGFITGGDLQNLLQIDDRPRRIKSVHIQTMGGELDFFTLSSSIQQLVLNIYVIDEQDNRVLTASADTISRAELEGSELAFKAALTQLGIASLEGRLNQALSQGDGGSTGLPISISVVADLLGGDMEATLALSVTGSIVYEFCQSLGAGPMAALEVEKPCDVDF